MFTQSVSSPPPVGPGPASSGSGSASLSSNAPAAVSSSSSSSRTSRLRGLSYLRNYHLLSREHNSNSGSNSTTSSSTSHSNSGNQASTTAAATAPATQTTNTTSATTSATATSPSHDTRARHSLTAATARSLSYSPPASVTRDLDNNDANPDADIDHPSHRMSLVQSHQEPIVSGGVNKATAPSAARNTSIHPSTSSSLMPQEQQAAAESATVPSDANNPTNAVSNGDATPDAAAENANGDATPSTNNSSPGASAPADSLPSIRFSAYFDPRATRPSLTFTPVARTLPTGGETIRVGRYSERENQPHVPANMPSAAPIGFKSKVVSRRHCEFWCDQGKWFIKDVKSSSGTFLNHIRLSPPGSESKPFPVNDGDIVQLGIDYKGGEEMIFRCVKMRLELNRGWQNKPNAFNVTTHKRLRNMASSGNSSNSSSQDCSICLNSIAPCQCLFVAPCSHTWHYKCIRSLLNTPQYPIFVCPNCRMAADLEADIEDPTEEWEHIKSEGEEGTAEEAKTNDAASAAPTAAVPAATSAASATVAASAGAASASHASAHESVQDDASLHDSDGEPMDTTVHPQSRTPENAESHLAVAPNAVSQPVPIPATGALQVTNLSARDGTPSPPGPGGVEGPITPRNDAGPWVFDGSAAGSRVGSMSEGVDTMRSLDAATAMEIDG